LELSNLSESATLFEQCLSDPALEADALLGLAECRRRRGHFDEAKVCLRDALVLDLTPERAAQALAELGQLAQEEQDSERAIHLLQQSVALNPHETKSRLALAGALLAAGQHDLAEAQREAARQIDQRKGRLVSVTRRIATEPSSADLRCQAGLALFELGLESAGADWLMTAVRIDPDHVAANRALAEYYRRTGDKVRTARHDAAARSGEAKVPKRAPSDDN
jgi:tetratricopeptide (TPR) repeat protein